MALTCAFACAPLGTNAQTFTHSTVTMRHENPALEVDGRPFFFFGAAFFYERIPASQWRASMLALHDLGFNTLDLYVPWNWHELTDGEYDFDGHTNARRNLRGVLALAREFGFHLIVRPGPVIRNEWRNGGYPAWLLTRPEYGMPLHDILEGRYPATATLQNANSDDAAAQWLGNATHMAYARRWLRTALREFLPYADLVLAVQLDDDQGAYIDNQTWPAPHLQAYLRALETMVREIVGPELPVFINTYEMKVTASAPVWPMGNWYQSDAYSIGEHDRAALEFSTGLLQTNVRYPVALSEFQAGWLAAPEDPQPRPADPTNTTLALFTLLGLGMRGVIDFPAQDTVNPAGWEAPFANASYAWDAALGVDLQRSARYAPTQRFGDAVRAYGTELAAARRAADGAIAYLTSTYDETRVTNADVFAIAARTQTAQQQCRAHHLTCDLVDLRFAGEATLRRYPFIIVPPVTVALTPLPAVREKLARYRARGGRILGAPPDIVTPRAGGIADATLLLSADGAAFLDVVNYDSGAHHVAATTLELPNGRRWNVPATLVAARDAQLLRFDPAAGASSAATAPSTGGSSAAHLGATAQPSAGAFVEQPVPTAKSSLQTELVLERAPGPDPGSVLSSDAVTLTEDDRAHDGYPRLTFANAAVTLTLAPDAGARAFAFGPAGDDPNGANVFTSVGALRDDVAVQPPLSTTDRIGKYTRSFPAGMFNRPYRVERELATGTSVAATLCYDAPDIVPNGAHFERTIAMVSGEPGFSVTERVTFGAGPGAGDQRAVRYDSFDARGAATLDDRTRGRLGFFYPAQHRAALVLWSPLQVEDAQLIPERTSMVLRLQFAPGQSRTRYLLVPAADLAAASAALRKEHDAAGANH